MDPVTELIRQHAARSTFTNVARDHGIADLAAAYGVQDRFLAARAPAEGRPAGYKIGLTSKRLQTMCSIDQPIAGVVYARRVHSSGAAIPLSLGGRIGLEFEICLRIGRDLPPGDPAPSDEEIAAAVDGVCAAFEIIDDRNADYADLDVHSMIADNSWNAGVVLGSFVPPPADLGRLAGTVCCDGAVIDRGHGRDALGHPFIPLAWLVRNLHGRGRGLARGDIVMTGSLVTSRFPKAGERYSFEVEEIGSVELTITA